jgi:2-polyprenyl-3-methyl-5-hydroxy-6-metoxy-1,4-benzoquinol methylase
MRGMFSEPEKDRLRRGELAKYDKNYFTNEYWKEDLPGVRGNRGLSYDDPLHQKRFHLLAEAILQNTASKSILDAGCGPAHLLTALRPLCGAKLVGVDAAAETISLANSSAFLGANGEGIQLRQANLRDLPFSDGEFELVVCLDVLEHIPVFDIEDALQEVFRVGSGQFIFSVNTDNAYVYHPTVLSKETWRAIFASQSFLHLDVKVELAMNAGVKAMRDEYDFFCYNRV